MSTVHEIKHAILDLPDEKKSMLAIWLARLDKKLWNVQIRRDFSEKGRGAKWLRRVTADFHNGRCSQWD